MSKKCPVCGKIHKMGWKSYEWDGVGCPYDNRRDKKRKRQKKRKQEK